MTDRSARGFKQSRNSAKSKACSPHEANSGSAQFDWPVALQAENFLRSHVEAFLQTNGFARSLATRMLHETATDFFEWTDHLTLDWAHEGELRDLGFVPDNQAEVPSGERVFDHPLATFPRVLFKARNDRLRRIALKVESIADFKARQGLPYEPEGEPFSRYRCLNVSLEKGSELVAVERAGYRGFISHSLAASELKNIIKARELWQTRRRFFPEPAEGFEEGQRVLAEILQLVDRDLACHLFFDVERHFWENRNRVARFQKWRQDQLGLGWANHDHHTFRCSREHFVDLISFLATLGFQKRERYYAGKEAGWGAQICEQPVAGIVVFADVDLLPDETELDFSSVRLTPASRLGTVGLWVALHGESFLEAGMHHLEARFDFARMNEQLKASGFHTMKPFSNFDFLRQVFTEGERWPVPAERIRKLHNRGLISREQAEQFLKSGAIGSHLENLQRHGGFKGFNQKSVSAVIQATDPRRNDLHTVTAA